MRKIILFAIIILLGLENSSAQLKTYTGPYKIASTYGQGNATATYTYIEDPNTLQRMKNGNFSLILKNPANIPMVVEVTGKYKNNLKDGNWITKVTYTNMENEGKYYSGTKIINCNYKDGYQNGVFQFNCNTTYKTKVYNNQIKQNVFSAPSKPELIKLATKFKKIIINEKSSNSIIVDSFRYSYKNPNINENLGISIGVDTAGFINGKYVEKTLSDDIIQEFKNGILIKTIIRNEQTGDAKMTLNEDFKVVDSLLTSFNIENKTKKFNNFHERIYAEYDFGIGWNYGETEASKRILNIYKTSDFLFDDISGDSTNYYEIPFFINRALKNK